MVQLFSSVLIVELIIYNKEILNISKKDKSSAPLLEADQGEIFIHHKDMVMRI